MSGISKRVSGSWVSGDYGIMKTATDTITTLPADIYADGNTATIGISGNTVQSGTPTPDNPIQPSECGERTGNLFDYQTMRGGKTGYYLDASGNEIINTGYWSITQYIPVDGTIFTLTRTFGGNAPAICLYDSNKNFITGVSYQGERVVTISSNTNAAYIRFSYFIGEPLEDIAHDMLNTGSTTLPYEPYGYKIPISSASTTTPVYLGEVETTRKVRRYEITGQENWELHPTQDNLFRLLNFDGYLFELKNILVCNTYKSVVNGGAADFGDKQIGFYFSSGAVSRILYIGDSSYSTVSDFKTYLQQQYANGTPVTIWYVLAAEETAVVNEPIRKIGDYADTVSGITIPTIAGADSFDVLTTLKPSEVSLSYTGWHDATVKEWDGSQWNE